MSKLCKMKYRSLNKQLKDVNINLNQENTEFFIHEDEKEVRVFSKLYSSNLMFCNKTENKVYAYVQNSGAYLSYLDGFSYGGCTFNLI